MKHTVCTTLLTSEGGGDTLVSQEGSYYHLELISVGGHVVTLEVNEALPFFVVFLKSDVDVDI